MIVLAYDVLACILAGVGCLGYASKMLDKGSELNLNGILLHSFIWCLDLSPMEDLYTPKVFEQ